MNSSRIDNLLRDECMRLKTGQCQTRACVKRGGLKRGVEPDYSKATCDVLEAYGELQSAKKGLPKLEKTLSLIENLFKQRKEDNISLNRYDYSRTTL